MDKAQEAEQHHQWMTQAIEQAEKSWSEGGIPIGSVLVDEHGNVIARGHNCRVQSGDPILHAEMSCIRNAGRRRDFNKCTLVSTLSPCSMCSGASILYKIPKVIIGENKTFMGAEDWMRSNGAKLTVLNDSRCIELMERL